MSGDWSEEHDVGAIFDIYIRFHCTYGSLVRSNHVIINNLCLHPPITLPHRTQTLSVTSAEKQGDYTVTLYVNTGAYALQIESLQKATVP